MWLAKYNQQAGPSKTAATVQDTPQKQVSKGKKTKSRFYFFHPAAEPRAVRDTRMRRVARNGLNVSSRGHKVSAQESMKLALETNGTKWCFHDDPEQTPAALAS